MLNKLTFYGKYFEQTLSECTKYKIDYLKSIIRDGKIYKFISFDENDKLNEIKIESFRQDALWFSHYVYLNDKTEFEIEIDVHLLEKKTRLNINQIEFFIGTLKEIYDVCSFTYRYEPYMWRAYANDGKGICIVFEVEDYDMLFPVDYINKSEINFTDLLIDSILTAPSEKMKKNDPMSILPYVVKNPMNEELESYKEKELRILYSAFDDGSFNDGIICPQIKLSKKYRGSNVLYENCGMKVSEIIIGEQCSDEIENKIIYECDKKGYPYEKDRKQMSRIKF